MKRYLLIAFVLPLILHTEASAQDLLRRFSQELRDQGRQLIQREMGKPQQTAPEFGQPPQEGPRPMGAIPSEGGKNSGGNPQDFRNGDDFRMPGQGQPYQPQPQPQDMQPFLPNPGTPYQGGSQPFPSDLLYRDGYPNNANNDFRLQPGNQTYPQPITRTETSSQMPSSPVMSNRYAVIRCPENVMGTIRYTLKSSTGSYSYTLGGGQEQRFRVDTPWSISYNDGSQERRYAIRGGKTYTMKMTKENRWQLYSVKSPGS